MGSSIQRLANIFVARQSCTRTLFRPSIPYRSFANYLANPEIVTLNHGPNRGVLDLKIFRSSASHDRSSRVILYLRSGIVLDGSNFSDESIAATLAASANATVVYVDYLGSIPAKFPNTIYNVLDAFDWVASHRKFLTDSNRATNSLKIAVCGQLLGGGLATMLGLTECRKRIKAISAIAVNNPILDWIFPESSNLAGKPKESNKGSAQIERPSSSRPSRISKRSSWSANANSSTLSAEDLYRARSQRFEQQRLFADPFASPILFFRSSGLDYSYMYPQSRSLSPSPSPNSPSSRDKQFSSENESSACSPAPMTTITKRKAARTYPPTGSGLILPPIKIVSGKSSILLDQAAELAKRYRSSVMKQNSGKSSRSNTLGRRGSRISSSVAEYEDDDNDEDDNDDNDDNDKAGSEKNTDPYADTNAGFGMGINLGWMNGGPGAEAPGSYAHAGFDAEAVATSIAKDQVQYEVVKGTGLWGVENKNGKSGAAGEREINDWENEVKKTGRWLASALDRD